MDNTDLPNVKSDNILVISKLYKGPMLFNTWPFNNHKQPDISKTSTSREQEARYTQEFEVYLSVLRSQCSTQNTQF